MIKGLCGVSAALGTAVERRGRSAARRELDSSFGSCRLHPDGDFAIRLSCFIEGRNHRARSLLCSEKQEEGISFMKNRMLRGIGFIGLVCLGGGVGCVLERSATQQTSEGPSAQVTVETAPETRPKSLSDTLEGCLARIPADSSEGARMVAEQNCRESEELRQGVIGTAVAKSGDRVSAGTADDSLEACLARIPSDATEGQRMLAGLTCERDQSLRH